MHARYYKFTEANTDKWSYLHNEYNYNVIAIHKTMFVSVKAELAEVIALV